MRRRRCPCRRCWIRGREGRIQTPDPRHTDFVKRTCRWLSWFGQGWTTPWGPWRSRPGPTRIVARRRARTGRRVLREPAVDLGDSARAPARAVAARVVDVGVEAVLVRDVAERAVAAAEVAAVRAAEVADQHRRRLRVRGGVLARDAQQHADEVVGAVAPPPAVRRALAHRVPRDEVRLARGSRTPRTSRPALGLPSATDERHLIAGGGRRLHRLRGRRRRGSTTRGAGGGGS